MESKSMRENNFIKLLINKIAEKKNWFIISFVTIFITSVFVPILMYEEITDVGVFIGMFELFAVVFLNCMIDFSYLHDSRKFSYYMSKPIRDMEKINVIIVSNIIFAGIFTVLLGFIAVFSSESIFDMFIVTMPWMLIGIFLAALSSVLVGNSIVAGIATCFNFLVPLSLMAVVYYIFHVIQIVSNGFNTDILMDAFVEKYYKIENLYFVKYAYDSIDFSYFILIVLIPSILYLITRKIIKRRKNERIGEFIVFDGYKNFISILISSLVPIAFLVFENDMGFFSQIVSFIIIASLSYYIILVILDKSFKIRKYAIKILAIFLGIFVVFAGTANIGVKKFESYVPNLDDVESIYIGNNAWIYSENLNKSVRIYDIDSQVDGKVVEIFMYRDKENISNILDLHKELINEEDYSTYQNIYILYKLKSGKNVVRYYELERNENFSKEMDKIAKKIIASKEYKYGNFGFIYDDDFFKTLKIVNTKYNGSTLDNKSINMNLLRRALQKDYDEAMKNSELSLFWLSNSQNAILRNLKYATYDYEYSESADTVEVKEYDLRIDIYEKDSITYYFDESFTNTISYLEKVKKGQ